MNPKPEVLRSMQFNLTMCRGVEVNPIEYDPISESAEPCDDPADADYWGVFLTLKTGGRMNVVDVFDKVAADVIAAALEEQIELAKGE